MAIAAEALLRLKTVFDGSGIDRASRAIGELQRQAGVKASKPLERVKQGLDNVGRAGARAAVGGVAATTAGLTYSAVKAVQFEDSLSDIKKALQLKVNSPQFKKLGDDFLKLSRNVPVAANELSELGGLAALAGKDSSAEILKFAGNTAKLGVAFRMPGREAAESFLAIQAQLGLTDEKTMDLMGTVNKLSDTFPGKVEARDILKGFQSGLGGVGKMAGMTGEQTAGFYSAFLAAGAPSDAAATAMKNFLNSLTGGASLSREKKAALAQLYDMPEDPARKILNNELASINQQIKEQQANLKNGFDDGFVGTPIADLERSIDEARFYGKKFVMFDGRKLNFTQANLIKKQLLEESKAYQSGMKGQTNEIIEQLKERKAKIEGRLKGLPGSGDLAASDLAKRIQADPEGAITDVLQRIKQLPKELQAGVVNDIFGKESQLGISAILANIGLVKQGFDVAGKATENASSWLTEYNSQLENSSSQFKLLRNAFDEMAIRIGQALLPVLTQAMRDLTPTIIELIPAVVELAKSGLPLLVQGLKAVLPYVQRFAAWAKENPQGLRDLIGTIGKVTAAFIALGVAAGALRSIGTVIGVLRTVGAVLKTAFAGKGAATAAAGGAGFFTPLINAAKGLGAKVLGPVRSLISALKIAFAGLTLKEVFPGLAQKLQKLRQMFGGKAGKPAFDISQAANNIRRTQPVNAIKPFARIPPPMPPMPWLARMGQSVMSLLPVLATVGRAVLAFFSGPVGWITLLATAAIAAYAFRDKLIPAFAGIGAIWNTYVVTPIQTAWTALVAWFGTTMGGVGSGLSVAWQTVSTFFNTYVITPIKAMWDGFVFYVLQTIQAFAIVWWRGVAAGFQTYVVQPIQFAWGALMTALSSLWTRFTTWLGTSIGTIRTVLAGIWTGIATTFQTYVLIPIQQGWGAFTQWFHQSTAGVRQWLMDLWQGVSQGFYTNVVQPIQEGWDGLTQWLSSTVGSVRGWFGSMWDGLAQGFSTQIATPIQNIWNGVLNYVRTGWSQTTTWFYGMFAGIGQAFSTRLVQPIRSAFSGLVSGLQGLINGLFGWLRNVGNTAIGFVNRVRGAAGMQPIQGFARGGHVSGPTLAWVGEGGDPGGEYIIPAKKMAGASMAYLSGARGASVIDGKIPGFARGGFVKGRKNKKNNATTNTSSFYDDYLRALVEADDFEGIAFFKAVNNRKGGMKPGILKKIYASELLEGSAVGANTRMITSRGGAFGAGTTLDTSRGGVYASAEQQVDRSTLVRAQLASLEAEMKAYSNRIVSSSQELSSAYQSRRAQILSGHSNFSGGLASRGVGGSGLFDSRMNIGVGFNSRMIFGSLDKERREYFSNQGRRIIAERDVYTDFWKTVASDWKYERFAKGGYVNRPTLGWIGEGGESEYIIPSSRMAQSAMAYLNGARGAAVLNAPGFATGGYVGGPDRSGNPLQALMDRVGTIDSLTLNEPPQINDGPIQVTTGPVLEFDGQRYVTMEDYQRGLRDVKRQTLGEIRTAAGRRATGR